MKNQEVKKSMETKENESGRSMVETLGVLAVMGVLSIGGVAGYRWAMDKYRSHVTIKELSERAVVYSQQMIMGATTLSSAEFNPANQTRLGYNLTTQTLNNNSMFFEIVLNNVPQRVCQNIVNEDWLLPVALSVNGIDDIGEGVNCGEEMNAMAFIFHRDLSNETISEGTNELEVMTTGSATGTITEHETGSKSINCLFYRDSCIPCDSLEGLDTSSSGNVNFECENICPNREIAASVCRLKRCPEGYIHDGDSLGSCIPCSRRVFSSVLEDSVFDSECQACGGNIEIETVGTGYMAKSCVFSEIGTNTGSWAEETFSGSDGIWGTGTDSGYRPEETGTGTSGMQICDNWSGSCYDCSYERSISVNNISECSKCDGSGYKWTGTVGHLACVPCASAVGVSDLEDHIKDACKKCNLGVDWTNGMLSNGVYYSCASGPGDIGERSVCGGNNPTGFVADGGACIPCSSLWGVSTTKDNCSVCGGQNGRDKRYYWNGGCYRCSSSSSAYVGTDGKEACLSCNTETNKQRFFTTNGSCYSCSYEYDVYVDTTDAGKESCLSCNTETNKQRFYGTNGRCYSCSYSDSLYIGESVAAKEACHSCNTPTKKQRYYSYGWCYPCPTSLSGLNTQEKCTQCGGTWSDSKCS